MLLWMMERFTHSQGEAVHCDSTLSVCEFDPDWTDYSRTQVASVSHELWDGLLMENCDH